MPIKKVVIESPFSGNVTENIEYTLKCIHDSHRIRKEAPIASHLLYTRYPEKGHIDDDDEERRNHGIHCGFEWNKHADLVAIYTDNGITRGMKYGIEFAIKYNIPLEYRTLK